MKRGGRYDAFVTTHNAFILGDTDHGERTGHRSPSFLPWHRRFLLGFERALQEVDASVALPYWDWTADRSQRSSLWAPGALWTARSWTGRHRLSARRPAGQASAVRHSGWPQPWAFFAMDSPAA